jgi:hypothetical protein
MKSNQLWNQKINVTLKTKQAAKKLHDVNFICIKRNKVNWNCVTNHRKIQAQELLPLMRIEAEWKNTTIWWSVSLIILL